MYSVMLILIAVFVFAQSEQGTIMTERADQWVQAQTALKAEQARAMKVENDQKELANQSKEDL